MHSELFVSRTFTKPHGFTSGIEGPACDRNGNLYAVNFQERHSIGKVAPNGDCSVFVMLPGGSTGCGIRFDGHGSMLVADHTNHNVLQVEMETKQVSVFAHEPSMNQPNDLAITKSGFIFASDPNWSEQTGKLWRINPRGEVTLLQDGMGTTNGIEISPDEKTLYINETAQRNIWAFDLTPDYEVVRKRLLIHFDDYQLDGMRCDMAGRLYVTRFGKGTIAVIEPSGRLITEIYLHGAKCTNLTFGGNDGRTCYVTVSDNGNIEYFRTDIPGRCWGIWEEI